MYPNRINSKASRSTRGTKTGTKDRQSDPKSTRTKRRISSTSSIASKRSRVGLTLEKNNDSDYGADSDEEDSEKEIKTVRDYEDAVRRKMLNSTTHRYDDGTEQDLLVYSASLMMSPLELQPQPQAQRLFEQMNLESSDSMNASLLLASPPRVIYSLGTFCLHAIVKDFKHLASDSAAQENRRERERGRTSGAHFRKQVQRMPFYLSARLFKALKHASPELLSTKIWTSLFFPSNQETESPFNGADGGNGGSGSNWTYYITDLDLEGLIPSQVTDSILHKHILQTLGLGPQLERVNLNGMDKLSDKFLGQFVSACPSLRRLLLKGCTKAGDQMLSQLPSESLQELNISFVAAATAKGIKHMLWHCRELRVLKLAGMINIRDTIFLNLEKELAAQEPETSTGKGKDKDKDSSCAALPLHTLQNLKISMTSLGDRGFKILMSLCGKTLKRLDISSTEVRRLAPLTQFCIFEDQSTTTSPSHRTTCLEKLNLTRLKLYSPNDVLTFFKKLPLNSLHTLLMGYLTCGDIPIEDGLLYKLLEPLIIHSSITKIPSSNGDSEENNQPSPILSNSVTLHSHPDVFFAPVAVPPVVQRTEYRLHTLSLFGNSQVGKSRFQNHCLHLLFQHLSPFLRRLELGYTQVKAPILKGLLPLEPNQVNVSLQEVKVSSEGDYLADNYTLVELGLDETPMGDDAAIVLSRFRGLNRLSLVNTRMSKEAVEEVIKACPLLTNLDLKSCRAIPILHRRTLLKEVRQQTASHLVIE
ncbi:hypothetical protein BX616_009578 [Lobosporangium transversale]|uniref:F-box domain-containing protein n=1 Tax=Lobosporangium transversale TaxID=64571 RepID=A0A1Y2GYW8_9FUNG|nr:hypothetical protein BCR41DRAFT_347197 [Lobosporangium transversale]KAF9918288.1 hypothetical protein BX616_009578 [Lobosporangium transversale]ORZ26994.1 hypothetical protein BCR41DRAFT_347197 [Lobosporangium transversale]|eukprot:XP_021884741.1 hypothetical protein BCR41DRAFT_347197 [Lobosporangium transversale]